MFTKYDRNVNVRLEMDEFRRIVYDLVEKDPPNEMVEILFAKMDANGDQSISLREFHARIGGE